MTSRGCILDHPHGGSHRYKTEQAKQERAVLDVSSQSSLFQFFEVDK